MPGRLDAGVALLPKVNDSATRTVSSDGHVFAMFNTANGGQADTAKQEAVGTFIKYMIDHMAALPALRGKVSDRAILRAIHVYRENDRVAAQVDALKKGDVEAFLQLVTESGHSSWMYLQNINPAGAVARQPVAFALALCEQLLQGRGACRVHGGGFAGTVQAFVPHDMLEAFRQTMEANLGNGSCHVLQIRADGGIRIA